MRKYVFIIATVFFGSVMTKAATVEDKVSTVNYNLGNSFIFVENGVTFSVFPDGEFDFYIDNRVNVGVGARVGNVGITFNSGFNYNPFVQYDDYGAIIQVENVPVFYDFYGRVDQIGGVDIRYRNGLVRRVGGLNVFYRGGVFSHYTGFVNVYNRRFVYRPYFRWFARPAVGFCNVWTTPYRRFYSPVRYSWYRPYRNNVRRAWVDRGREYRFNRSRRANIYRNDNRVSVRKNRARRNSVVRNNRAVTSRSQARTNNSVRSNSGRTAVNRSTNRSSTVQRNTTRSNVDRTGNRSNAVRRSNTVATRSNRGNTTTQRKVTRTPRSTTVTKREVNRTPQKRTVSRTSTTYKKPQSRSVVSNRSSNTRNKSVQRSSTPQRRTVSRSTSTNRSSSANSRSSRSSRRQ
ncbi:hypothetical protein [uncultured Croceitalea sp.]|uniref:hypothetical protein n=1 Tax=uncultured Croceitalea sp. TaxID=1798908 RepID=UPI00330585E7